jgi:hypothetical protein
MAGKQAELLDDQPVPWLDVCRMGYRANVGLRCGYEE